MKQRLLILVYGFIGWTLFFLVARGLFMIYHGGLTAELHISDIALTFVHGIQMDWAVAGYLTLIPGLLFAFTFSLRGKYIWPVWIGFHTLMLLLTSFIIVLDFELYKHWGFRLDATPLLYVGKEAAGTGEFWTSVFMLVYWLSFFSGSLFLSFRFFKNRIINLKPISWIALPVLLICTVLLIIPIRGSFGVAPMNTGFVFFHPTNVFANHSAINVVWNFGYAVHKVERLKYPDSYFDKSKTETYYKEMFPNQPTRKKLIGIDNPNIMIILMESYTFRLIEPLDGVPGVTPNFNSLIKEGVLFDNFYSSGDRTDKGLISVLSGFPAQPLASIIKYPNKTKNLPFLNQSFKSRGYHTEFTYGYNIDYANFRSYLINAGFDNLTHSVHFSTEQNTSKWGVHDHFVFDKFLGEAEKAPEPFFKIMMTQSSHEPFEVPMETVIKGEDEVNKFLNSAYYTDKSLGEFISRAKKSDWWKNTLVIITADHGARMPDNNGIANPNRFKIPMLWMGGALTTRDTVIHTIAGHPDIANTVLGQVGTHDEKFVFSNNIFSNHPHFAVYIFNNGFGMMQEGKYFVFDNNAKKIIAEDGNVNEEDLGKGKAYIQKLYWNFNSN